MKIIFTLSICILLVLPALAKGAPPATPIDGGLSALLAAGGLYGLSKLRGKKKQ